MSKKLYVEKLQYFNGHIHPTQYTNNMDNIRFNCGIIGHDIMKISAKELMETDKVTITFPVGRFLCILAIYLDQSTFSMMFIDLKNNDEYFYEMLQHLSKDDSEIRTSIISTYNQVKKQYKSAYNDFEIIEGVVTPTNS